MQGTPARCPPELTHSRLKRLGEGIGKVVYASEHWVVKRERTPSEVVSLILLWKFLQRTAHRLPFGWGDRLLRHPSREIRFLRALTHGLMIVLPKSLWYTTHVSSLLRRYVKHDRRGERLARARLTGTDILPQRVTFPPATVLVGGWPGWLVVTEATERVEATLDNWIKRLAASGRFDEVELWLNRLIDTRQAGWRAGLFSTDAHLKNFGVAGGRVVLLDTGGLTDRWSDISARLEKDEQVTEPHVKLGLGAVLAGQPEIAARFNSRWKATVNRESVREHLPG